MNKWLNKIPHEGLRILIKEALKYGVIGFFNTLFTYAIFFALINYCNVHYKVANPLTFLIGFVISFYFNRKWTFKSEKSVRRDSILFSLIFAVSFGCQFWLISYLTEVQKMKPELSQIFAMVLFTTLNFSGNKLITFKKAS